MDYLIFVEFRYYYINGSGKSVGPVLLTTMRRLWNQGTIGNSTEICRDGTQDWDSAQHYPEITEPDDKLTANMLVRMAKTKSNPWRLTVWMILLGLAFGTWLLQQWIKAM